jgi:hypothetical protein
VVPASLIKQAMGDVDYQVDTLKLLDVMIWAQERLIAVVWQKSLKGKRIPPELDTALRTLLEYAERRHKVAIELGVERQNGGSMRLERHQSDVLDVPVEHHEELLRLLRVVRVVGALRIIRVGRILKAGRIVRERSGLDRGWQRAIGVLVTLACAGFVAIVLGDPTSTTRRFLDDAVQRLGWLAVLLAGALLAVATYVVRTARERRDVDDGEGSLDA